MISSCLGQAPSQLVRPLRSRPPPCLLQLLRFRRDRRSVSADEPCWVSMPARASWAAMAFSPATVNFSDYASAISRRVGQASSPVFALIFARRPAFKLGRDLLRGGGFHGLRHDRGSDSLRSDASDSIANCVSVSLAGEFIGIILSVLAALSPSPPRAPNRRRAGRGRRIRRSFHRRVTPAGA